MWRILKWCLLGLPVLGVVLFLHYTLPHRDTVRITGTYNRLTTIGANSMFFAASDVGTGSGAPANASGSETRDIRFIEAVHPNGKVIVYRNEDTGWVWPPYFKYDSANLQAEASNARSDAANAQWVIVTHYGWRIPFLSIYPNAVKIRPALGPDDAPLPWVNGVILLALAFLAFWLWRMWERFRDRVIDPIMVDVEVATDRANDRADAARRAARTRWGRFWAWIGGLWR